MVINELARFYEYLIGNSKVISKPKILQIEPTNNCNLSCKHCPNPVLMTRDKGYMQFSLYKLILNQVKRFCDQRNVKLHHLGESLLNRDLPKIIKYTKENGFNVILSTNGTLISKFNNEWLNYVDWLWVSLDYFEEQKYSEEKKGDVSRVINNLNNLRRKNIVIQIIADDLTNNEMNEIRKKLNKYNSRLIFKKLHNYAGRMTHINTYEKNGSRCIVPWYYLTILWDGQVVPCCYDYNGDYIIGNLKKNTIKELWNNYRMERLRKQHVNRDLKTNKLCKNCSGFDMQNTSLITNYLNLKDITGFLKYGKDYPLIKYIKVENKRITNKEIR